MLQFPYGVNPNNGISLDGKNENEFSCIISGTVCTAYQITIMDNNTQTPVYNGEKNSVNIYNGQELKMIVPADSFTNGKDLIWKVQLWTNIADIPSFTREGEGSKVTKTFVDNITTPYYFFKSRSTPIVSIENFVETIDDRKYSFIGNYSQSENSSIQYYIFNLYNNGELIDTTDKVFSADLQYNFDGFISNEEYEIEFICVSQDNVEVTTGKKKFSVSYNAPILDVIPEVKVLKDYDAVQVEWQADKQSIPDSYGEYKIIKNFPFYGTNSVELYENSSIIYNKISDEKLLIDSSNFSVLMSTNLDDDFIGEIISLYDDENNYIYIVGFDGTNFYYNIGEENVIIGSPYENTDFVLSDGIAKNGYNYIWEDENVWSDSLIWTESIVKISQNQYKISILPTYASIEKVVQ